MKNFFALPTIKKSRQIMYLLCFIIFLVACKKDSLKESYTKDLPVAIAGPDQVISLDSVFLSGGNSYKSNGTITGYLWTKISGPVSFNIIRPSDSSTKVKFLVVGVYQFELKVTDNGGLSASDTVQITVNDAGQPNRSPVANAGADQTITLPTNTVDLDGIGSTDPENNITAYLWTKISGPSSFNIATANSVQTQVTILVQGVYGFELKVTDNTGLFARDTVEVTVIFPPPDFCNNSNRPEVSAQLVPVGTLSELRYGVAVASAGNKILFAGGYNETGPSSRIDIYDVTTQAWSTAELTVPGYYIKAVTCSNKIFLAGGEYDYGAPSRFVDIYDAATNTWSVDSLSEPRWQITMGAVGNKVFFAGGEYRYLAGEYSSTVDIYDVSTNTWTTKNFNVGRAYMTTVTSNNKLYFAGGLESFNDDALDRIDIYDNATNSWSVSHLSEPKIGLAAIAVADKIYWAGGVNRGGSSCSVEIKDINTGTSTNDYLCKTGDFDIDKAITKDGKIIFRPRYYNEGRFDIYDIGTNSWHIGVLPLDISFSSESILSVNNTIYIAGAIVNGIALSNQIWKLEF